MTLYIEYGFFQLRLLSRLLKIILFRFHLRTVIQILRLTVNYSLIKKDLALSSQQNP